jgi:hypothetical protein
VWVYGSLVKPGRFHEWSDVDVALESLPAGKTLEYLQSLLSADVGREVDVCFLDRTRLRPVIEREGSDGSHNATDPRRRPEQDARVIQRGAETLATRLHESAESRWAAAAFEINRIDNVLEKAFERLCETSENHLEKTGRYRGTLIERVTLDLKGIRHAFPAISRDRYREDLGG